MGSYDHLRRQVLDHPILASDGNHSARLWRVAECVGTHASQNSSDDRLLHLMSRVGILCEGMANDLRSGDLSLDDAARLLNYLAKLGELSFGEWLQHK